MPEGALLTHTVEAVLHDLADSRSTGCLVVRDQEGDEAEVYLRDGDVYAVSVPGRRVMLGVRLMSSGALTPEALAEALEIQRTELQGWRLGELLVHLGYVDLAVVEEFVVEHLKDALTDLLGWPVAAWKFRKNKKTRQDVAPPTPVAALFDDLRHRATTWETILEATGGPDAVPSLASSSPSDDVALGPNEWALLCKVDGSRAVTDLATECGFTLFEAGQVVMRLGQAGLVSVPGHPLLATAVVSEGEAAETAADVEVVADVEVEAAVDVVADVEAPEVEVHDEVGVELVLPVVSLEELAAEELAAAEAEQRAAEQAAREAAEAEEREQRRVAAESKRLAEAEILHRELEALAAKEAADRAERAEARRRAKAAEAARTEAALAELEAAEERARVERAEAERSAAAAEQRAAAEHEAWDAHAEWLAAQRAAAEDEAWHLHEAWLADRAAEQAAEAEAALRVAREQAERELHAEVERRARAAAEAEVRREAERIAREEAARQEREETDRLAAEAAEQIARDEAGRVAAEQQAARELAVEAERRAREAAEAAAAEQAAETARVEAERAEAERLAAEQEAARVAAERQAELAAHQAAVAEAERLAAEQAQLAEQAAARLAAEDAARRIPQPTQAADDRHGRAAHAASMLTELNRDMPSAPPVQPPAPEPEPAPAPEPVAAAADTGPAPMVARDHADTAMLLRELSSLGFGDDDGPTSPAPTTSPRASQPVHHDPKKKRKGLFGRG